jgi:excisionase family DNA binding protein
MSPFGDSILHIGPESDDNRLLRVKDVAVMLDLSEQTIRKWIKSGALKVQRLGQRSIRVRWIDVLEYINE